MKSILIITERNCSPHPKIDGVRVCRYGDSLMGSVFDLIIIKDPPESIKEVEWLRVDVRCRMKPSSVWMEI